MPTLGLSTAKAGGIVSSYERDGLVAYYPFNSNNANDMSTNTNNGTVKSGRALAFDGAVDYLNTGYVAKTEGITNTITVACWIKTTDVTDDYQWIWNFWEDNANGWGLHISDENGLLVILEDINGADAEVYPTTIVNNTWYRIVVVMDDLVQKLYINGSLSGSGTTSAPDGLDSFTSTLSIGSRTGTTSPWAGSMSDFQIWNTAWTLTDVQNDYTHPEMLAHTLSGTSLTESNLKLWLPMTEGNPESPQTTIFDGSGNKNHATSVFYGTELVTNGTLETNTTGWTNVSGATFERNTSSPITGTGDLHWVGGGSGYTAVRQTAAISVVSGKTYKLTYNYRVVGTTYISAKLSTTTAGDGGLLSGFTETELDETSNTAVSYTFVSGATDDVYLMFRSGSGGAPEIYVDDISLKEVGLSTTGHVEGQETIFQPAFVGQNRMIAFDGVDDKVTVADTSNDHDNVFAGGGTISAWVCPHSTGGGTYGRVADKGGWMLLASSESGDTIKIGFNAVFGGNNMNSSSTTYAMTKNTWTHVVITYNSSSISNIPTHYANGSATGQSDPTAGGSPTSGSVPDDSGNSMYIAGTSDSTRGWDGFVTEVSLWDEILTAAQVQELYNDGVSLKATEHSLYTADNTNLKGYWVNNSLTTAGLWEDLSTYSNHGTLTGGSTVIFPEGTTSGRDINGFFLTHPNKNYLSLDSSDSSYVEISDHSTLRFGTGDFTIECWAKAIDWDYTDSGNDTFMVVKWEDSENYWYLRTDDDGQVQFFSRIGNVAKLNSVDNTTLNNNTWYHICYTADRDGNGVIYLNGDSADTTDISGDSAADYSFGGSLYIGRYGATQTFNGQIDDVRLYTKVLTASEVTKNYRHGTARHKE